LRKPFIGGLFQNSSDEQAQFLGNPVPAGFYVQKVLKDTIFEKAGVKPGDMLYMFNGYIIDAFGEATVPWSSDRVLLRDLISRLSIGDLVSIIIYRKGEKKEINVTLEAPPVYPVRPIFPGYETIDYEVIGGMVIMQLTDNHLPFLTGFRPDLFKYLKIENKLESILIITHILPGSYAQQLRCLLPGDVIKNMNGIRIKTLNELREALKKSIKNNFLSVETDENTLAVFEFRAMIKDEATLAASFAYPMSIAIKNLIDLVENEK
jgi:S1-C subfamily serine protease